MTKIHMITCDHMIRHFWSI